MGSNTSKQDGEKGKAKRRSNFKRILHISSRQTGNPPRPVSYAGIDRYYEEHHASIRPMSMIDVVPLDISETIYSKNVLENCFFFLLYLSKKHLLMI
jgi:hypothetical protein